MERAIEQAYRDHGVAVYRVAARIGGASMADDVTQEVFLRYGRLPNRFDPERGSLVTFLVVMARGIAIDMLRSDRARRTREEGAPLVRLRLGPSESDVAWPAIHRDIAERMQQALDQLERDERDAIVMAFYGGLTYRETAKVLGAPEGTVKSRIRSGLRRLSVLVKAHDLKAFSLDP